MKKIIGLLMLLATITVAGVVVAQTSAKDTSRPGPPPPAAGAPCPGGPGMCGGMGPGMHHGMMGHMDGAGFCPMPLIMNPAVHMDIKNTAKGATVTLSSDDPKQVARIQKTLEIVRLMRELRATE